MGKKRKKKNMKNTTQSTPTTIVYEPDVGMPRDLNVLKNAEYLRLCFAGDDDQIFVEYGAVGGHIQGDIWRVHDESEQFPEKTLTFTLRFSEKSPWTKFAEKVEDGDEIWIVFYGDIANKFSIDLISARGDKEHSRIKIYSNQVFGNDIEIPKCLAGPKSVNPIPVMQMKKKVSAETV